MSEVARKTHREEFVEDIRNQASGNKLTIEATQTKRGR